jgi:hypothetical protein
MRRGLIVLLAVAALSVPAASAAAAPVAARATLYPLPRVMKGPMKDSCLRSAARVHAVWDSFSFATYRSVCRFYVVDGRLATITSTRPTRCSMLIVLRIGGVVDSRKSLPSYFC